MSTEESKDRPKSWPRPSSTGYRLASNLLENNMYLPIEEGGEGTETTPSLGRRANGINRGSSRGTRVVWRDVKVVVEDKVLLKDVAGVVEPGEILAVMGPSGAGKTTLLNTLAGRIPDSSLDTGSITFNGEPLCKRLKRRICYVLQQDIFFATLTLRDTLMFTAMLRLPDAMPYAEKVKKVDWIVDVLDLKKCLDTQIGNDLSRGLSGGEKKRANIGCELLTDPALILLDEPTSGLDSSTALSLIRTVKRLAMSENKTVVTTIHQPSSQIFKVFDKLCLVLNGELAYFGKASEVLDFFEKLGMPCEPHYNPADFILEKMKDSKEVELKILAGSYERRKTCRMSPLGETGGSELVIRREKEPNPSSSNGGSTYVQMDSEKGTATYWADGSSGREWSSQNDDTPDEKQGKWPTGFLTQYRVLTQRNFLQLRPKMLSKWNFIQTFGIGLIIGLMWFQVPHSEERIMDVGGVLFFCVMYWGFVFVMDALSAFPMELVVLNKERAAGYYRLSAYYLAKLTSELPLTLLLPSGFLTLCYWMAGLSSVGPFFATWAVLMLSSLAGQSLGLFISAACLDFQRAVTVASIFMMGSSLLGGFYTTQVPHWLAWVKYSSFMNYAFHGMLLIQFTPDNPFSCAPPATSAFELCRSNSTLNGTVPVLPSEAILGGLKVDLPLYTDIAMLVAFIVVFRALAYVILRFIYKPR
ncbi:uncharacterized protein [Branchiostoma lanceolatum]|uniref:uncharacterized protein isoform X2 n=1 Tax=Branchiostoma lanceolatum TaxID=7740 RepID=UPI0034535AB5